MNKQGVADFENTIRQEGFPEFKISPAGDRDQYTAIKFIEPFDWRNQRAFGYDMYSNPVRRKAMDRAATTGLPSISGKITLVQETNEDVQSGILCYLPIYEKGEPVHTVAERKKALVGWVYAAFRCNNLMDGILGEHANALNLEIFDTEETTRANLLFGSHRTQRSFDSRAGVLSSVVPVHLAGRIWTMRLRAQPEFFTSTESLVSPVVGGISILISILLYVVLLSVTRQRENAIELAQRMTRDLAETEKKTRSILENASEAILSVTEAGEISAANRACHQTFATTETLVNAAMDDFLVETNFEELAERCRETDGSVLTTCGKATGENFQCSISIGKVTLESETHYIVVARDETARIIAAEKLAQKNKQLFIASHRAGMAEVATGVLHNVGNVLNSVNVSTTILRERLTANSVPLLKKGVDLLTEHQSEIVEFLTEDTRGKHFPEFIKQITETLVADRDTGLDELESLEKNVEHIRQIVAAQQTSASCSRVTEPIQIASLIDSAVKVNVASMTRHDVEVATEVGELPAVVSEQHSILQILINLIKNAKEACVGRESSTVRISAFEEDGFVRIDVTDNGVGISSEQLGKLFQHGFTTKADGHGFGLHAAANSATKLGGSLSANSDGLGKGTTFTLRIPCGCNKTPAASESAEPSATSIEDDAKSYDTSLT